MTAYAEVNHVLGLLLSEVTTVLGKDFVGLYLWGSLATGDFDRRTSDIDFVAVPSEELPEETIRELEAAYVRITGTGLYWANRLEGDFIPKPSLRRYEPADGERPRMDFEDGFVLQSVDPSWRSLIRRALAWPRDTGPAYLDDARALIRFTLMQAGVR